MWPWCKKKEPPARVAKYRKTGEQVDLVWITLSNEQGAFIEASDANRLKLMVNGFVEVGTWFGVNEWDYLAIYPIYSGHMRGYPITLNVAQISSISISEKRDVMEFNDKPPI